MKLEKIEIAGKQVWPITNCSGILATDANGAANLMSRCEYYGIWTTKGTSLRERVMPTEELMRNNPLNLEFGCREPILVQESEGTFLNVVKLINDGAEKTRNKILNASIPKDRVVWVQVFGNNANEITKTAESLEDIADGIQINFSCPHAEKTGMVLGQDPEIVNKIVRRIREITKKDIDAKLTPNTDRIGIIANAAVEGGANWISGINTTGPFDNLFLYNSKGGRSGRRIIDIGLQRVREIKQAIGNRARVTAMGGVETSRDIEKYIALRADVIGLGSVFCGMDDNDVINFLPALVYDMEHGTDIAGSYRRRVDMSYKKVRIEEIVNPNCDFKIFRTNVSIDAKPGQFVFAFLPGNLMPDGKPGEKPFSIMDNDPLTLGVLTRGYFTRRLNSLRKGDSFYYRGPHGKGVDVSSGSKVVLVGGGCGIAGIYFLAKRFSEKARVISLLGAKDKQHLSYADEFQKYGEVYVSTEDGSLGIRGTIIDLIDDLNLGNKLKSGSYFFNCGPKKMIEVVMPLELEVSCAERIYYSVDYMTRCGVGICGSCVDKSGRRTCVEGPFMK